MGSDGLRLSGVAWNISPALLRLLSATKSPFLGCSRAKTRYSVYSCYTQENFARALGISLGTLRQWEQKRRRPTGAARVLLALLDRDPAVLDRR
jgi:hypothetical protein